MGARPSHFEIPVDDPDRAEAFYRDVFGWSFQRFDGAPSYYGMASTGEDNPGINGALYQREPDSVTVLTMSVPSIEEAIAKVEEKGGKVVLPKTPIPGMGWFANLEDTEGNRIGIFTQDPSAGCVAGTPHRDTLIPARGAVPATRWCRSRPGRRGSVGPVSVTMPSWRSRATPFRRVTRKRTLVWRASSKTPSSRRSWKRRSGPSRVAITSLSLTRRRCASSASTVRHWRKRQRPAVEACLAPCCSPEPRQLG